MQSPLPIWLSDMVWMRRYVLLREVPFGNDGDLIYANAVNRIK